jgi:ATP-dependent helicase HrpB
VRRALRDGPPGDVLVFLPGAAEIRRAGEALAAAPLPADAVVLPLHGDLPLEEQTRAVRPEAGRRKIILATNVAESSITVEGVVAVVDCGLARVATALALDGLPTLAFAKISQASATQRAGRAGRTRPGRALRLYTRHDLDGRRAHDRARDRARRSGRDAAPAGRARRGAAGGVPVVRDPARRRRWERRASC